MRSQEPKKEVKLEDVLKMKRFEQPEPAFWNQFDAQLKRNLMKSMVSKRSVRSRLSTLLLNLAYSRRFVGAAAALSICVTGTFLIKSPSSEVLIVQDLPNVASESISLGEGKNYVYNTIEAIPAGTSYTQENLSMNEAAVNKHYLAGSITNLASIGSRSTLSF